MIKAGSVCRRSSVKFVLLCVVCCFCLPGSMIRQGKAGEKDLWQAVKQENHFVLIRHALAPGTGDPPDFNISDCTTQRNLLEKGRNQAGNIGRRFREKGIHSADVYSSQWCRCLETAALLDLGPVHELPILNSFFRNFENKAPQTAALKTWLNSKDIKTPLILVTHQVNVTAFTDIFPGSGEMIIVRKEGSGEFTVLGSIDVDY